MTQDGEKNTKLIRQPCCIVGERFLNMKYLYGCRDMYECEEKVK